MCRLFHRSSWTCCASRRTGRGSRSTSTLSPSKRCCTAARRATGGSRRACWCATRRGWLTKAGLPLCSDSGAARAPCVCVCAMHTACALAARSARMRCMRARAWDVGCMPDDMQGCTSRCEQGMPGSKQDVVMASRRPLVSDVRGLCRAVRGPAAALTWQQTSSAPSATRVKRSRAVQALRGGGRAPR